MGDVSSAMWSNGTSITMSPTANSTVKGIIYKTGSAFGNSNVMFSYASFGNGKVAAIGDSSPCDDGTGDSGDQLYNGWTADAGGNHERLIMNATIWLASTSQAAPAVVTLPATAVTGTTATLNGSVNPNGIATTYHFEWGTTASYGSVTSTISAGSGSTAVNVSANISGLTSGTTYHFRIAGTNSAGTSNGSDLTFTPGMVTLSTTAVTSVTMSGATSGGTITSDGGAPVTMRGVCWSTSSNPVVTNSHTSDGTGTGSFVSSITGLTANTLYHVRAYATNSAGTFYGNDIQFTTICALYTLPFSESFSATTLPGCWSQIDHQGNGEIWTFGTLPSGTPLPALTGNYAFLNSDGFGSGNSQNADLVSPSFDLSAYGSVTLQFSHYFKSYTGSSGTVSYSTDNGSSWTQIVVFTATSASNPATFSQVISAVAGQSQVKFKWNYTGTYGFYWAIDNISITGTAITTLTVTPPNQNVSSAAGTTPFAVTTAAAWTAASNSAWCTVTPSGTGNGTLTATYTQNTGTVLRVATVTVTVTGASPVAVTVTQDAFAPSLSVTPPVQNVTAPAGNTSFTVTSNAAWTVISDAAWCTVTPSGSGNGTISATYLQNSALTSRTANITVSVTGITPVTVMVTQAAAAPALSVTPASQTVGYLSGNTAFTVTSNTSWTATCNQAWCLVTASGSGNGTLSANFSENTFASDRTATITVVAAGIAPVVVTLIQQGPAAALNVTPSSRTVTDPAGSTLFNISSNTNWTCSSDVNWCQPTPSGSGSGILTATYQQNLTPVIRTATLQVFGTGLSAFTIRVMQLPSFVSVGENPESIFQIFPNPTSGIFTLSSPSEGMAGMKVNIYNAEGKPILTRECQGSDSYTFNLSREPKGIYFINTESAAKTHLLKILVQ